MKLTRLFTGDDQMSHFEEVHMELFDVQYGKLTRAIAAKDIYFGEIEGLDEIHWHNPPSPHFIIMLTGAIEIEVGNGSKKIFNEGDVLLAEDTTGQGHITRSASKGVRKYLMIPVASNNL